MLNLQGKQIVIAGGSGFLGVSMARFLAAAGASVSVLSRSVPIVVGNWTHHIWDARSLETSTAKTGSAGNWVETLDGADAVINLAGRSVNCIKTPDHQDEILRSRVEATRVLGAAMRNVASPPPVWVQMSTAHIYGDPPRLVCTENSELGFGFAPQIGRAWEQAFTESKLPDQRGVVMRTSFVIGRDRGAGGGAMATLGRLARFGLGGRVGSGTQGMSWIHETDLNRLIADAIENESMTGVYIASSPHPVSQIEFMRTLRRAVGMPIGLPAFEWMVRFGAPYLLRTDPELALYGRYVVSERLPQQGFVFAYPELEAALQAWSSHSE
ncbi:TIGR01777 family oxidoreductase [Roseimaritima ulvae]|uniref:Epimerase family protein n=1 Tax=Roseimaritima ulvae TaxID=980254 RepID=A0A5B9QYY4_9BACT|nr:TIGR01777 family oxidoreductase [Roseimaritima ulvae]QEG39193.1 Epimerase family protein [Roseimaritima ulvae]